MYKNYNINIFLKSVWLYSISATIFWTTLSSGARGVVWCQIASNVLVKAFHFIVFMSICRTYNYSQKLLICSTIFALYRL